MNPFPRLLLFAAILAVALVGSGCSTVQSDLVKILPPGDYKSIETTITGKFSATQVKAEDVTVTPEGRIVGGHVHVRHSNIYVPLIELDVQAAPAPAVPK